MSNFGPNTFYGKDQYNQEKTIRIIEAQAHSLQEQNKHLKDLVCELEKSSKSAEKSAKHSKVCTIISLIIAGLMFITSAISIGFDIWKFNKEQTSERISLLPITLSEPKELW